MEKKAKFRDCGLAYLLCFVFVVCVSFVVTSIISSVATTEGVPASDVANREWVSYLNTFLSEFVFILVFFVIVFIRKDKGFAKTYRLKFKFDLKIFLSVFVLGIFVMLCSLNMTNLVNKVFSFVSPVALTDSIGVGLDGFGKFLLAVLLMAILPCICEELVFRGIIYNGLRQRYSYKISILLSTVMFVLMHMSIYKSFYQAILGVVLGLLMFETGTIFYGIVFHFANNFSILFFNYVFGANKVFEFVNWGFKEIAISVLIFAIGFAVVFLFFKWLSRYVKRENSSFELKERGFELEESSGPLDVSFCIDDSKLSYEQKILFNDKKNEGFVLLILSVAFGLVLWSFNSFGGFL